MLTRISGGQDNGTKQSHRTAEFGSVKGGDKRVFPEGDRVVLSSVVNHAIAVDITCWEADASNSSWYNGLKQALNDAAGYCLDAAVDAKGVGDWGDKSAGFAALVVSAPNHLCLQDECQYV